MSDEFFDDFEDDFDGEPGDYEDDGLFDGNFEDSGPAAEIDDSSDPWEIPWDGLEWQDWMIIGPLSEEISHCKKRKTSIK